MRLMLPRAHASWAVFFVPIAVGFAAARGGPPLPKLLFCCAALGLFLMRAPLRSLLSPEADLRAGPSAKAFGALALAGFLPLLAVYGRWGLLWFAVAAAGLMAVEAVFDGDPRLLGYSGKLAGIAVLSLGAPAALVAARGSMNHTAWAMWLLCALYFSGTVFHVKMAALEHLASLDVMEARELSRRRRLSGAFHTAALLVSVVAVIRGLAPAAATLPFAVALAKTLHRGFRQPERVDFQRLGLQEAGYSFFFLLALTAGYRLG
jgi:hypothetical protein